MPTRPRPKMATLKDSHLSIGLNIALFLLVEESNFCLLNYVCGTIFQL